MNIALVVPESSGGVGTATNKLYRGLLSDGFNVVEFKLPNNNMATMMYLDISHSRTLKEYEVIIYMGSIAWPSHIFLRKSKKGLFLHGFVHHEMINNIKYLNIKAGLMSSFLLAYWHFIKSLNSIDFYICRSRTSYERNGMLKNCVILPQFVLQEDVQFYNKLLKLHQEDRNPSPAIRIVTYTSSVISPRLLGYESILLLSKKLKALCHKKFEIIIVDPMKRIRSIDAIRVLEHIPRNDFLRFLATSDLYLERCLDEELGNTSLEAGLLGIPVAKITDPIYLDRQDYNDQLILSTSINGLASKIAEYINHIDYYKPYYSDKMREFIICKRVWDNVKVPLIKTLKRAFD